MFTANTPCLRHKSRDRWSPRTIAREAMKRRRTRPHLQGHGVRQSVMGSPIRRATTEQVTLSGLFACWGSKHCLRGRLLGGSRQRGPVV